MTHNTEDHDGEKCQEGNQKQRCRERIASCRREHESGRVDGRGSNIDHDHIQSTHHEKGYQYLLQSSLNDHLVMRVLLVIRACLHLARHWETQEQMRDSS